MRSISLRSGGVEGEVFVAEEALEDQARVDFGGHRRGGRAPRNAVGIGAAVSGIAIADGAGVFAA